MRTNVHNVADVEGTVADQFAPVAGAMLRAIDEGGERGLSVCAYLEGEKVVDLWCGSAPPHRAWQEDTLTVIFSATKGCVALCAQLLADRGLLDIDAPVSRYWPEYAVAGKENTLVRHVLSHTAGVLSFPRYWEVTGIDGRGFANVALITERLGAAEPSWPPGTVAGYHALTYGYLTGELVRRVDGRSIGQFFNDEVATPLGLDLWIGLPEQFHARVADAIAPPAGESSEEAALRAALEDVTEKARAAIRAGELHSIEALFFASLFMHPDLPDVNQYLADIMNLPYVRSAEMPGGNAVGNARSLARMYAPLSMGGELEGRRLVSAESIARFSVPQTTTDGLPTNTALGFVPCGVDGDDGGPTKQAFGHPGAGGQLGMADPGRRLSFAYIKNQMLADNAPTTNVMRAVYACL
jgi:CubicO group peptidase (beta-lactamase class C family)